MSTEVCSTEKISQLQAEYMIFSIKTISTLLQVN